MTRDKQLAAFIAGTIQAALDNARSRGYPPELGLTEPRNGTWTVWAAGEDSRCTVTIAPGAGLLTRQGRVLVHIEREIQPGVQTILLQGSPVPGPGGSQLRLEKTKIHDTSLW